KHVDVELETDLLHFARLLLAQYLARAADFEVVHGEIEAGAQLFHELDRLQPFLRLRGERFLGRRQQIRVRLMVRAADAAAQLMQLREPKAVRTVDYDRVGSRDIEPRLDDRRAQEEIAALLVELAHDALKLAPGH